MMDQTVNMVADKAEIMKHALANPLAVQRELNDRSLYEFMQYFWPVVSPHDFTPNWHIEYICGELENLAYRVADRLPKENDVIINVPPGSTKTITCLIMFVAWCWTKWYWMRFITVAYSSTLSLESADYCRDLIRSKEFQDMYPELSIKEDKDTKSNFKIVKKVTNPVTGRVTVLPGGNRFSTSVGATLTGFHGDIILVDDPLNPKQAASEQELASANHWIEQTLSTRKTNKAVTPTVLIMQRLHHDDPSGHILKKNKKNLKHICIPGEIKNYREFVRPLELVSNYTKDGLMDPVRLPWSVLEEQETDLGQWGYAGQFGQNPVPPGGGMFKVDHIQALTQRPPAREIVSTVRFWDKAATQGGKGAFSAGVKMSLLYNNRILIEDVKRGRWSTEERENIIRETAIADGVDVSIWIEQEPGSGGKESAENTIRNLLGFVIEAECPTGDKVVRAIPFSVQLNNGNVSMLPGGWNDAYLEELRFFPLSTYKDQVDASSGAFNKLAQQKICEVIR